MLDFDIQNRSKDNSSLEKFGLVFDMIDKTNDIEDLNTKLEKFNFFLERRTIFQSKLKLPPSHYSGKNLWFLKPIDLNRGQGLQIFSSIDQLKKQIKEMIDGFKIHNP